MPAMASRPGSQKFVSTITPVDSGKNSHISTAYTSTPASASALRFR